MESLRTQSKKQNDLNCKLLNPGVVPIFYMKNERKYCFALLVSDVICAAPKQGCPLFTGAYLCQISLSSKQLQNLVYLSGAVGLSL